MKLGKHWIVAAILLGTFVFGLGIGAIGTMAWIKPAVAGPMPTPDPGTMIRGEAMVDHIVKRMEKSLKLDEGQREAIREELAESGQRFRQVHQRTREAMETIMKDTQLRVERHLSAEQTARYRVHLEERMRRFEKWEKHREGKEHRWFRKGRERHSGPPPSPPPPPDRDE